MIRHTETIDAGTSEIRLVIFKRTSEGIVPADEEMPISCLSLGWKKCAR